MVGRGPYCRAQLAAPRTSILAEATDHRLCLPDLWQRPHPFSDSQNPRCLVKLACKDKHDCSSRSPRTAILAACPNFQIGLDNPHVYISNNNKQKQIFLCVKSVTPYLKWL